MGGTTQTADQAQQYVNTMVFCIVAGIVSLMLLLLIMSASEHVRRFSPFIITIEVGLVLVIVLAIVRLIMYEREALKANQLGLLNKLSVQTCPDYWTRYGDTCVNGFSTSVNPNVTYRIAGSPNANKDVMVTTLALSDYDNMTVVDACTKVNALVQGPWTDVRSVCDSYRVGS
jgi:hypothetical protein